MRWFKHKRVRNALVAICPDARGVAAAAVTRAPGVQPVLEWASYQDIPRDSAGRRGAVAALEREHALGASTATSLLPPGEYSLLLVDAPSVPPAELREAVRWRVKDLVDFDIGEAIVDVFRVPTMKGGRDDKLYAVVARRDNVRRVLDEFAASELELAYVDIPEFALRNIAALLPEDVAGVAFLHLDAHGGLITITRQSELFLSRRFEGGAARILAAGSDAVSPENEGLLEAVVIEVQRSLDYYESQFAQAPVRKLVVAPLTQAFTGLDDYLGSQLGIEARMLTLDSLIDTRADVPPALAAHCLTAIGAALRLQEQAA